VDERGSQGVDRQNLVLYKNQPMTYIDIEENIKNGVYNTNLPLSLSKEQREEFKKQLEALDNMALTVAQRTQKQHEILEAKKQAEKKVREEHQADSKRLKALFREHVEQDYGFSYMPEEVKQKIHDIAGASDRDFYMSLEVYDDLVALADLCFKVEKE
jgi:Asp-tRNA(Asn)/Glu-tRNA(Gln) amidotransferase C subunit